MRAYFLGILTIGTFACVAPREGTDELAASLAEGDPGPPALTSVLSGTRVTSRPTFAWKTSANASESVIEIARDRAGYDVVARLHGTTGAALTEALPRGTYFVRGFGRRVEGDHVIDGAVKSAARAITVTGRDVVSRHALEELVDIDNDGIADTMKVDLTPRGRITVSFGDDASSYVEGDASDYAFGEYARAIGDTDGDGRTEIVTIAALRSSGGDFVSSLQVQRLQLVPGTNKLALAQTVSVAEASAFRELLSLGDVDGDGYADVGIVRALPPRFEVPSYGGTLWLETGVSVELLFGSPAGFDRSLARRKVLQFRVPAAEQPYGGGALTVRAVGDMNGDGYPELAIGVPGRGRDAACTSNDALFTTIYAGSPDVTYTTALARLARIDEVLRVGDVNGDGLADVASVQDPAYLFSCPSHDIMGLDPSRLGLTLGSATGAFTTTTVHTLPIDEATGCQTLWLYVGARTPRYGVAYAGDRDADGFDDVTLGMSAARSTTTPGHCTETPSPKLWFRGAPGGLIAGGAL